MDRALTALQRLAAGGTVCLLLVVPLLAAVGGWDGPAQRRATHALLSPGIATTSPLSQLLGPHFTLPVRERSVRVARALTADLDADGDIDAIAATSAGKVLVWINVGRNRLERRLPVWVAPGQPRIGRPFSPGTQTVEPKTLAGRWLALPPRRLADTPLSPSSLRAHVTRVVTVGRHFELPPRAPPRRTSFDAPTPLPI